MAIAATNWQQHQKDRQTAAAEEARASLNPTCIFASWVHKLTHSHKKDLIAS
jgi:hypothetical protein